MAHGLEERQRRARRQHAATSLWGVSKPLIAAVAFVLPAQASAQDAEQRIRQLEEQVRALTQELQAVKAQIQQQQAAKPVAAPAPETAPPQPARRAEVPGATSTGELQDRVQVLEQRIEQQGIQARFSEGIIFEDPRGNWTLRVTGRLQLDYRDFSPNGSVADTFSVRRARLGVDTTVFKDYRIVVEGEFANGNATGNTPQNVALTLGYFDIGWFSPYARLRLGQFKPAFGYEQTLLDLYSSFMERGLTQN